MILIDGKPSHAAIESALMVYSYEIDDLGFQAEHSMCTKLMTLSGNFMNVLVRSGSLRPMLIIFTELAACQFTNYANLLKILARSCGRYQIVETNNYDHEN